MSLFLFMENIMPAQIRMGVDVSAGTDAPPTAPTSGSKNCFSNGIATVGRGDSYAPHGIMSIHGRNAVAGHSRSFINGKNKHRNGDAISCGDIASGGSQNIFVGTSWGD